MSRNDLLIRNSGFVITAAAITVDDTAKYVTLVDPSIINAVSSFSLTRAYHDELVESEGLDDDEEPLFYVRASIIVDPDASEVTETAIARNIATPIKSLTEAGARHQLDDLEKSIGGRFRVQRSARPKATMKMSSIPVGCSN